MATRTFAKALGIGEVSESVFQAPECMNIRRTYIADLIYMYYVGNALYKIFAVTG